MLWVFVCTALAFCGIAVLGALALRVHAETVRLARQVGESSRRLAAAAEEFRQAAEPVATRAGEIIRR